MSSRPPAGRLLARRTCSKRACPVCSRSETCAAATSSASRRRSEKGLSRLRSYTACSPSERGCRICIDPLTENGDSTGGGGSAMNEDTLKGQWNQLKGKAREKWGMLTNDDLNVIQGQTEQLVGLIQQRYGIARDEAERQVKDWIKNTKTEPTPTR